LQRITSFSYSRNETGHLPTLTGDFDADGDADILLRHNDGTPVIWEMENGSYVANHNLPTVSTSYQVAGTGDFNDDGGSDIVWRHNDGSVVMWVIEDASHVVTRTLPSAPTSWQMRATGDFDLV
jgi:hypothetical protein